MLRARKYLDHSTILFSLAVTLALSICSLAFKFYLLSDIWSKKCYFSPQYLRIQMQFNQIIKDKNNTAFELASVVTIEGIVDRDLTNFEIEKLLNHFCRARHQALLGLLEQLKNELRRR